MPPARPSRAALVVVAVLALATLAALLLAGRLKRTPPAVLEIRATPLCSPNGDGRFDACRVRFELKRDDDLTVRVEDDEGRAVRVLVEDRSTLAFREVRLRWDGRDDDGRRVPDGRYRLRVTLQRQGRSLVLPRRIVLDVTPPRPRVLSIGPTRDAVPRPEVLPNPRGRPASIRIRASGTEGRLPELLVYRTHPSPGLVRRLEVSEAGPAAATWDGTRRDGRRARPGTYVVAVRSRDKAGNVGVSTGRLPPPSGPGVRLAGRGGITVRYLGVQPPSAPVVAGTRADVGVDARRAPYRWRLRRVGRGRIVKESRATRGALTFAAPDDDSGLYLLEVRTATRRALAPLAVQGLRRRPVLVVLPALQWNARSPADDDGDGLVNTLEREVAVRRERIQGRTTLPRDLLTRVAPLLAFLDRQGFRYDLTTDAALASGDGPPLGGHRGVLLAGDERWLPVRTQRALVDYVRDGGVVANFGVDALRRSVRQTPARLVDPTTAAREDAFGARQGPLDRGRPRPLTVFDPDRIGLFGGEVLGGGGVFRSFTTFEPTLSWPGGRIVASAALPDGRRVVVAARVGRGLVIRFGLPELPRRLRGEGEAPDLVRRTWRLLRRGGPGS